MQEEEILGKAYDARLMKRLLQYVKPYRWWVVFAIVLNVIIAGLGPIRPYLTKVAIDDYILKHDSSGLFWIALSLFGVLVFQGIMQYLNNYFTNWIGQRTIYDMRVEIFTHLQNLSLRYFDKTPIGRLVTRVTNDVEVLNELFSSGIVMVFSDVFIIVWTIAFMFAMDVQLSIVTLSILPLLVLLTAWFRKGARDAYREVRIQLARINTFVQEHITGMNVVQIFHREKQEFEKFKEVNEAHTQAHVRSVFFYAVFYPGVEFISAIAVGLIIWYGGGEVVQKTISLGVLISFIQYTEMFFRPIRDLSEKYNILQSAMASSERVFKLLDTKMILSDNVNLRNDNVNGGKGDGDASTSSRQIRHSERSVAKSKSFFAQMELSSSVETALSTTRNGKGTIEFKNVWFRYDDESGGAEKNEEEKENPKSTIRNPQSEEDFVLKNISFTIESGTTTAIVGATGSGKSTVVNLLMRFYDIHRGEILLDGMNIRFIPQKELRKKFAVVLQDVFLFSGDITSNITLGNEDYSLEEIEYAAKTVGAHSFIERLPKLYNEEVKERGATLSVGQKQLISFARALVTNPEILILDEATSSIDTETEQLIQSAITNLLKDRTSIVIAHRLSTIQHADKIIVLHKGEIREVGTHQELLALEGLYYKLYLLQYKEQETVFN